MFAFLKLFNSKKVAVRKLKALFFLKELIKPWKTVDSLFALISCIFFVKPQNFEIFPKVQFFSNNFFEESQTPTFILKVS
jgi:hypothetical protein